ncbi:protease Do-like 7 isoform X2 [Euphorbia lathyris]|uniref:protease Do-like 7 isoform X2 n=1 Tax=Euphorbia lathyris TaxID=212925 RepID=UPI00331350A2
MEDSHSQSLGKLESEMDPMALYCSEGEQDNDLSFREKVDAAEDWKDTINKVVPAVVVLRITSCRSFDTESPSSGYATGFIVDKQRGIILTNRHVVKPGPVVGQAIFLNHEELPVYPIYRDPVHDFGFFRYDPAAIQFLDYEEIPLAPEAATVGLEIRVVGNDSREKVSILAGTLARLDRDAPTYRTDGYNDFNTFYIQAASGTRGGSSGSPVIDQQGRAVALNAGANLKSSSAFYLPLERVVRALRLIQSGWVPTKNKFEAVPIPRGTLQVTFHYKGFDEVRRLGLRTETEQMVRHTSPRGETGMLVVHSVVPGGSAFDQLEPGDVLVCMNGEVTTRFLELEKLLDDSVDQVIVLDIERGGMSLTVNLVVEDLHSITPYHFLEVSGAVIHPLSYQQARNFRFNCGIVYISDPGYMLFRAGVPRHAIIEKFADVEISQLEDVISVLSKLSRGARVPLEYITHTDRHRRKSVLVTVDHHEWYDAPKIYTRDDGSGLWIVRPAYQPESPWLSSCINEVNKDVNKQTSSPSDESTLLDKMPQINDKGLTNIATSTEANCDHTSDEICARDNYGVEVNKQVSGEFSKNGSAIADTSSPEIGEIKIVDPIVENESMSYQQGATKEASNASFPERVIEPALVMVEVNVPPSCLLDGVHSRHSSGTGIIVHHSEGMGLVAVDRNVAAISASDVLLSFAAFPIEIPGQVVFLHPVYNFALVAYDPSALGPIGGSMVRVAQLCPEPALCRGDTVFLVGLRSLQAISRKSTVTNPCLSLNVSSADPPCYSPRNMEVIELDSDFGYTFTGVLTNELGKVQAIWARFTSKLKSGGSTSKDSQFVKGIPIYIICQVLDKIIDGANGSFLLINGVRRPMPLVRTLEVELIPILLSKARTFGLSDDWIQAMLKKDPTRRQVLRVKACLAGSKAVNQLKQGDMVLAVNKESVTCFRDLENALQKLEKCGDSDGQIKMTIFRQGSVIDLLVRTEVRDGNGTTHMINWCGCILQYPHQAVRALGFLPKEGHGVYIAKCHRGSPADRYGLCSLRWIVEVNGKPTPDLDAIYNVTKELGNEEPIRIRTVNLNGKPQVLTLKQDLHYWPTWELRFDPDSAIWRRDTIKALEL